MTQDHKSLPNIARAALEMSYDNGGINRDRSEDQQRAELDVLLGSDGCDYVDLKKIDDWIATLTDEEIQTLVAGEESEMQALTARSPDPEKTSGLMEAIFEGVC